jgi:hypothetical protein
MGCAIARLTSNRFCIFIAKTSFHNSVANQRWCDGTAQLAHVALQLLN